MLICVISVYTRFLFTFTWKPVRLGCCLRLFQDSGFRFTMETSTGVSIPRFQVTIHIFIPHFIRYHGYLSSWHHTLESCSDAKVLKRQHCRCLSVQKWVSPSHISQGVDWLSAWSVICYLSSWYFLSHTSHLVMFNNVSFHHLFHMGESDYLDDNLRYRSLSQTKRKIFIFSFISFSRKNCHVKFSHAYRGLFFDWNVFQMNVLVSHGVIS